MSIPRSGRRLGKVLRLVTRRPGSARGRQHGALRSIRQSGAGTDTGGRRRAVACSATRSFFGRRGVQSAKVRPPQ